jgi:hypothetical protein
MKTIYRYEVPIDDQVHSVTISGNPLAVAFRPDLPSAVVEFWAEARQDTERGRMKARERTFQVFGTGQSIPDRAAYWGTTARYRDPLFQVESVVFHLYEIDPRGPYRSAGGPVSEIHVQPSSAPAHDPAMMIQSQRRGKRS